MPGDELVPRPVVESIRAVTVGYLYLYACSAGIQGVLRELLYHRGGTVDDLSGGDLLGYQGIEYRYLTQEGTSASGFQG